MVIEEGIMIKRFSLAVLVHLIISFIAFFVGNPYEGLKVNFGFPGTILKFYYNGSNPNFIFRIGDLFKGEYGISFDFLPIIIPVVILYFLITFIENKIKQSKNNDKENKLEENKIEIEKIF